MTCVIIRPRQQQQQYLMSRNSGLWTLLFAFLALTRCVHESSAFTFPSSSSSHPRWMANQQGTSATITTTTSLFSTVVDAPTKTKETESTKTIEIQKEGTTEKDTNYGGEGWEIRLWNDPFNKREFVALCLSTICGKSDTESYQIMMQAHKNGYVSPFGG